MKKPIGHISIDSVYGTKCLLHVTNIVLFGIVIILAIVSACIYCLMPVADVTKITDVQGVNKIVPDTELVDTDPGTMDELEGDFYNIIATRNVFSPQRKDWVVKAVIPKAHGFANKSKTKKTKTRKKAFAGKPKKFILHGILIAGNIKKALIKNPLQGVRKEKTLYVEEGEDLDGYKVKSIEKDRIKLDWHGEEIIVLLYSGINANPHHPQNQENEAKKPRKERKSLKVNKSDISIKKQNEAKKSLVASVVDIKGSKNVGESSVASVFDDALYNPSSMAYESLFMSIIEGSKISGLDDIKEAEETSHDISIVDRDPLDGEHVITKVDISGPLDITPEEELNEKLISKGPVIINLHGIFIVGGIRKAMIDNPLKGIGKKQALYVEEGDELDGCRVASIDKEVIRLDCQGEERVVALNSAIEDYKQEDYVAEGSNKTMEIMEADEDDIEVGGSLLAAAVDDEGMEEGSQIINVFDDEPFNPMSMASESLFMPAMNDVKISAPDEIQEVTETFSDLEVVDIDHSDEEQIVAMVQPTDSIYKVPEEEELRQNALSNVPTQIVLKGIVIAGNIKKALVNVPKPKVSEDRTLYVEEGDELEEYMVTEIEPSQIRLAWQGEEMIITFPSLY